MKKVLFLALGMLLIPFTAFGMQMMADSDMESITGQSGVAISLENVQVYTQMQGEEIWYETDGNAVGLVYDSATYSYLYVTTLDYTDVGTAFNPLAAADGTGYSRGNYDPIQDGRLSATGMPANPRVLTIRVKDDSDGDRIFYDGLEANAAFVEIGLPTLELYEESGAAETFAIYVVGNDTDPLTGRDNDADTGGYADDGDGSTHRIGRLHMTGGDNTTAIFGGRLGITSYNNVIADHKNPSTF